MVVMPFGDRIVSYTLDEDGACSFGGQPCAPIEVPSADKPWWWSEYLTDQWKRKKGLAERRESRTGLQRAADEWKRKTDLWDATDRWHQPERRHDPWGTKE